MKEAQYDTSMKEAEIPSIFSDDDLYLFGQGKEYRIYEKMGAHVRTVHGITDTNFATWGPKALAISVIGDFNNWRRDAHPMLLRHRELGVWECFVPGIHIGAQYKFAIYSRVNNYTVDKTDPYGFASELRPKTASIVTDIHQHTWQDEAWMNQRGQHQQLNSPISIYEVHLGSWRHIPERHVEGAVEEDRFMTYRELAVALSAYVKDMGFTHIELMPVAEYPFDGSWGYQTTGYYAPTSRFGTPEDFQYYVDYLRKPGEWVANRYGGREHLEAVEFLRQLNEAVYAEQPGTLTIAEESTAWPLVTRPTYVGGLGFSLKWNMGWMHDMLDYMHMDPIHRRYHHNNITFSLMYAYSENFVLPLSHDEVVHIKGSLINKMPGDLWQQFANLRAFFGYMWGHPGKKLLFMGGEFGQWKEWNFKESLDWHLLGPPSDPLHAQLQSFLRDLNQFYTKEPAFSEQ